MALIQASQMKMLVVFLAIMVLMSSAAASFPPQDFILKPLNNLGRKLLGYYDDHPQAYPTTPSGGGSYPCCG